MGNEAFFGDGLGFAQMQNTTNVFTNRLSLESGNRKKVDM